MKRIFGSVFRFLKRNVYYVLLIVSIAAIGTMVTIAVIANNNLPVLEDPIDDPVVEDPIDDPVAGDPIVFIMPVTNYTLGMEYSGSLPVFHSTLGEYRIHKGIDFKAEKGTDALAVYDGTVQSVTTDVLNGTVIVLKHNDDLFTVYKSLAANPPVKAGDRIMKGDVIGKVSDTALNEILEGSHLHFEVLYKGVNVDPADYLPSESK